MKSNKVIEVSKSSLVSLKAELVRKQEEAQKAKGSESYIRPQPKKKKEVKVNPGIEERKQKDEITQEEVDLLQKSREVLEVKSRLYDKLQKGDSVQENVGDPYLVDFREKLDSVFSKGPSTSKEAVGIPSSESSDEQLEDDYDDEGWVDYTDCLGRTRRCLKEDLDIIKKKDEETSKLLGVGALQSEAQSVEGDSETSDQHLEMISGDMERQKMREKWEQQERILLNKKNIYYEDIRFDEARTHGVAYYNFSTEESKREEEQAEFKRIREETAAKQRESKEAKQRRDMMKQSRLMAARNRQRARLGLPPLSSDIEVEEKREESETEEKPEETEESKQDLEESLARAAHVRPWDIGKDGVKQSDKVMTQEEWIDKKRQERPDEFAPPVEEEDYIGPPVPVSFTRPLSYSDEFGSLPQQHRKRRPQKPSKRLKVDKYQSVNVKMHDKSTDEDITPGPRHDPEWTSLPSSSRSAGDHLRTLGASSSRGGVEIPPPPTFDYYTPARKPLGKTSGSKSSKEMIESIEAGLEFLRKESEKKERKAEDYE